MTAQPAAERLKFWLVRKIAEAGSLTGRQLAIKCAARDRHLLADAIATAMDEGRIRSIGSRYEISNPFAKSSDRFTVIARMSLAWAPWFEFCRPCNRELDGELVGQVIEDGPTSGWLCVDHLIDRIRQQ